MLAVEITQYCVTITIHVVGQWPANLNTVVGSDKILKIDIAQDTAQVVTITAGQVTVPPSLLREAVVCHLLNFLHF